MSEPTTGPEHIRAAREYLKASTSTVVDATRLALVTAAAAHAGIARVLLDAEVALEMGGLPALSGSAAEWRSVIWPEKVGADGGPVKPTTPRR